MFYTKRYPLISILISNCLSTNIQVLILLISIAYPKISFHLSCWIFDPNWAGSAASGLPLLHCFTQATVFILSRLQVRAYWGPATGPPGRVGRARRRVRGGGSAGDAGTPGTAADGGPATGGRGLGCGGGERGGVRSVARPRIPGRSRRRRCRGGGPCRGGGGCCVGINGVCVSSSGVEADVGCIALADVRL